MNPRIRTSDPINFSFAGTEHSWYIETETAMGVSIHQALFIDGHPLLCKPIELEWASHLPTNTWQSLLTIYADDEVFDFYLYDGQHLKLLVAPEAPPLIDFTGGRSAHPGYFHWLSSTSLLINTGLELCDHKQRIFRRRLSREQVLNNIDLLCNKITVTESYLIEFGGDAVKITEQETQSSVAT